MEDEVAALRAAAAKMREEANKLSKEMGKEVDDPTTKAATPVKKSKALSPEELTSVISSIDFESGNAATQSSTLDSLAESGKLRNWKSAVTSNANTDLQKPLRPYPVSLNFLENRSDGKVTAESLGVSGDMDVSLDDFKDATIVVAAASAVLAIGSLALLPENIGATLCYFFALVPIVYLGIGSSAPGIIAGLIKTTKGTNEDADTRAERICRHEAAHFLCGYLCGLPIRAYSVPEETGVPCVEFHESSDETVLTARRELSREEIAALSVVAMSGSVAEVLEFEQAKGGENDLLELDGLFRRSKEFLGAEKQQDLTRWGALISYQLLKANKDTFERLVKAFKERKSVGECVCIIES